MGNSNKSSYNEERANGSTTYDEYSIPNGEKENKGFFDNFLCCGTDNNRFDNISNKAEFLKSEFYWFYESSPNLQRINPNDVYWTPYPIDINHLLENTYLNRSPYFKFNFADEKSLEFIVDFGNMTQTEVNDYGSSNGFTNSGAKLARVRRFHRQEEKFITRKSNIDNSIFLNSINFIREYNNTHNIQQPIKLSSFFKYLSFPIKCLDLFNQEIYIKCDLIPKLKNYLQTCRINSFPHLKQLITQEISLEADKLNNTKTNEQAEYIPENKNDLISNYLLQKQIYNEIIETNMNQDNIEGMMIHLFYLEGFINERINLCLKSNSFEFSNLRLFFVILQASISKQSPNDIYKFMKSNSLISEDLKSNRKTFKLYKGCYLDTVMIQKYLNMLNPHKINGDEKEKEFQFNSNDSLSLKDEIMDESTSIETLFKRDEKYTPGQYVKSKSIKASLEFILNDFKKKTQQNTKKEMHFCLFNEILTLTYDKNSILQDTINNNAICIFHFDSSLFSGLNQSSILKFFENWSSFNTERLAILSAFSIFNIENIEVKTNGNSSREFYELNFSFVTNGSKNYDYLCFSNHQKMDLHSKNLNLEDVKSISNSLKVNPNIIALNLHGNKLGADSCKILGEGLKANESLKLLSLSSCNIDSVGAEYLAEALKKNKYLQIIWMSHNKIGSNGIKSMMEMLKTNEKIESIWFDHNGIGYEGGIYISEMLLENKTLKYIYLRHNDLGPQGIEVISEAIKLNKTLEGLHLSKNNFGPMGAMYLADALKINLIIKEISINGNKIEKKGADCIADLLDFNKKIFVGKVDY